MILGERRLTRSARSSSASLPVPSTLTRAPKILILSVSMANCKVNSTGKAEKKANIQVFAIKIFAFSIRLGQLTPIDLSRMKPTNGSSQTGKLAGDGNLAFIQVRVCQLATNFFDYLNVFKVC